MRLGVRDANTERERKEGGRERRRDGEKEGWRGEGRGGEERM